MIFIDSFIIITCGFLWPFALFYLIYYYTLRKKMIVITITIAIVAG